MWQIKTIEKYKNDCDIFVETGTWMGDGIQTALHLGFKNVYSCDIDKENIVNASNRFKGLPVTCFHQSSEDFLKDICPILKKPSLIWLDAHVMPDSSGQVFSTKQLEMSQKFNVSVCPIIQELSNIFTYGSCDHVIMIDDYHCFGNWEFSNLTADETKEFILSKNEHYKFSVEENVLCCFVENKI